VFAENIAAMRTKSIREAGDPAYEINDGSLRRLSVARKSPERKAMKLLTSRLAFQNRSGEVVRVLRKSPTPHSFLVILI
jgi:hypothetical protein